ncbi:hypothetical protein VPH35_100433 [Triticum aestivum]
MKLHLFPDFLSIHGEEMQSMVEELGDDLVLGDGLFAAGLEEVEGVALPRRLPNVGLPAPPAGPEPVVVGAAAVAEHVALADAHQHAPARQGVQARRAVHERVDERVVLPGGGRAHDAPQARQALPRRRVEVVGGHLVGAEEVWVDHEEAVDGGAVGQPLRADPHRHVVRDVGAGALAAEVEAGEVGVVGEPWLEASGGGAGGGVGDDPGERVRGVGVGGGDGVLGREAVLDGDDEHAGERGEVVEVGVEGGVEGGAEAEAAAVVVDEDGELGVLGGVEAGEVEARGDLGGDDAVAGGDPGGGVGVGGGGDELGAEVALHAVLVDADAGHGLVDDLVVGRGRRGRDGGGGGHRARGRDLGDGATVRWWLGPGSRLRGRVDFALRWSSRNVGSAGA